MIESASLRVLIVAEHASGRFGGEAILPLHYFRVLRSRGIETWMIVHARTRDELSERFPLELDRLVFIRDSATHRFLWRAGKLLPDRLARISLGWISRCLTQWHARQQARRLIQREKIDVIHQPMPVSPKEPSFLFGVGVPVVIGPLNGGMDFPPAFRSMDHWFSRLLINSSRAASFALNYLIPGKLRATTLLVANSRTREALPAGVRGEVVELVENGVDLSIWSAPEGPRPLPSVPTFVYLGRLVDWKAVDILIEALARIAPESDARLEILGDGSEREALEALARHHGLEDRVEFAGWMPQEAAAARLRPATALVLSSLFECGGAVVLEAMAAGLPVIASDWGGPADYLDESCGILIPLTSREDAIQAFAAAMGRLAAEPDQCAELGGRGLQRVLERYDWERKGDQILEIYTAAIQRYAAGRQD